MPAALAFRQLRPLIALKQFLTFFWRVILRSDSSQLNTSPLQFTDFDVFFDSFLWNLSPAFDMFISSRPWHFQNSVIANSRIFVISTISHCFFSMFQRMRCIISLYLWLTRIQSAIPHYFKQQNICCEGRRSQNFLVMKTSWYWWMTFATITVQQTRNCCPM